MFHNGITETVYGLYSPCLILDRGSALVLEKLNQRIYDSFIYCSVVPHRNNSWRIFVSNGKI